MDLGKIMNKYFIMGWDNDSEEKRYKDFYFVGDKLGNLLLFSSIKEAEALGRKTCKYCKVCDWHNYITGDNIIDFKRLKFKEING